LYDNRLYNIEITVGIQLKLKNYIFFNLIWICEMLGLYNSEIITSGNFIITNFSNKIAESNIFESIEMLDLLS